ncbi:hypothetical protein PTSG_01882 [Salpingoeca rosetta]|uniref:Uncharacterized protein n=1 Tax=Salpingoeca rosetta (strain ATCC 50818 / BSB-021) TaxID=946362 RepID=F2TZ83_SALR5|nr:uncharacterized protein PTSG_01882 [Salpingoeca rosetta]EGD78907.1 hypothetical protein PTSG_01882 [Salpingoeca rosetta]|eukprot:XP_004997863.1 hypothetical protein PTSG_01882 [Salpingoeca rosetta]
MSAKSQAANSRVLDATCLSASRLSSTFSLDLSSLDALAGATSTSDLETPCFATEELGSLLMASAYSTSTHNKQTQHLKCIAAGISSHARTVPGSSAQGSEASADDGLHGIARDANDDTTPSSQGSYASPAGYPTKHARAATATAATAGLVATCAMPQPYIIPGTSTGSEGARDTLKCMKDIFDATQNARLFACISKDAKDDMRAWCLGDGQALVQDVEDLGGKDTLELAQLQHQLGSVLDALGEHDRAIAHYTSALAITRKVLGERHAGTACMYNNLGTVFMTKGNFEQAITNYHQALNIKRSVLGEQHPSTATTYSNLALLLETTGDSAAATQHHHKALSIRRRSLGETHPSTAASYNNLGLTYQSTGDHDAAIQCLLKDLKITIANVGHRHLHTAASLGNLANAYSDKGDYAAALEHHHAELDIKMQLLGLAHPDTADTYNNMAGAYTRKGDFSQAESCYRRAITAYRASLGDNDLRTAEAHTNMGIMYEHKGDLKAAARTFKIAHAMIVAVLGDTDDATQTAFARLQRVARRRASAPVVLPLLPHVIVV